MQTITKSLTRSLFWLVMLALLLAACSSPFETDNATPTTTGVDPTATLAASALSATPTTGTGATPALTAPSNTSGGTTLQAIPEQEAVIDVVNRSREAVVTVVNLITSTQGYAGEALGTGIIADQQGHIFTNNHVIAGSSPGGLSVIFANGDKVPAQLVGADEVSDLAVLHISQPVTTTLALGDSSQLQVGQTVIAIGSALGDFRNTVTVGVVSGLNRSLPGTTGTDIEPMIQTDAAINHGNSGGPLLDTNGQVIGINTAAITSAGQAGAQNSDLAQGLGFAIPSNTVKQITGQIISSGSVPRPYLGISSRTMSAALASYYNLRDQNGALLDHGALVVQVEQSSAAASAGLTPGDVIVALDNTAIDDNNPLINLLMNYKPGDQVQLSVIRNGQPMTLQATLGTRPASGAGQGSPAAP